MKKLGQKSWVKILTTCIAGLFTIIAALIGIVPEFDGDIKSSDENDSSSATSILNNSECVEISKTNALYDGYNYVEYCGTDETFSMGANVYNAGFVLETKEIDSQSQEYAAYVLIDLENKFSNVSFLTGRLNGSPNKNATLTIYKDAIWYTSYKLSSQSASKFISIPTSNATTLRIELTSLNNDVKYGFANVHLFN